MDTVFKPLHSSSMDQEHYLLEHWGICDYKDFINDWVDELKSGVRTASGVMDVCKYDIQNLQWSGKYLLNSVSKKLKNILVMDLGSKPDGPVVFCRIVNKIQQMSANAMRYLEAQLKKLKLSSEPGENIETFSIKVKDIADRLDQGVTYKPPDLAILVAEKFIQSSVEAFRIPALNIYDTLTQNPTSYSYQEVLEFHCEKFCILRGAQQWPPFQRQTEEKALKLQRKTGNSNRNNNNNNNNSYNASNSSGNNSNSNNNSDWKKNKVCFDCNQRGHVKGDPECPKEQERRQQDGETKANDSQSRQNSKTSFRKIAPKPGQPEEKTVNGVKFKLCATCGFWSKTHGTAEHQAKGKITMAKTSAKPPDWEPKARESEPSSNDAVQINNEVQNNQGNQGAEPVGKLSLFGMFTAPSKFKNHDDFISPRVSDDDDNEFMLAAPHPLAFKSDECEENDQVIENHESLKCFHPNCESHREN